ncbi:MAG: glycosyltransferase family 4 protein, partial [Candidatus Hydrogenedentes bacterium]|nr:glycosyltransferase family 4 protein [Candidatus Hydrogenedentota bacterium]
AYDDMKFRPTYLCSTDRQMIGDFGQEMVDRHPGTVCFVSEAPPVVRGEYVHFRHLSRTPMEFSENVYDFVMPGGGTLIAAMQIGYHMGIRTFYLYGVDHNLTFEVNDDATDVWDQAKGDGNHFIQNYRSGKPWAPPLAWQVEAGFLSSRVFLESRGGWVKNATHGGKLDVLDRVDFDVVAPEESFLPVAKGPVEDSRSERRSDVVVVAPESEDEVSPRRTIFIVAFTPPAPPVQGNRRAIFDLVKWLRRQDYHVVYILQWLGVDDALRAGIESMVDELIVVGDRLNPIERKLFKRPSPSYWPETGEAVAQAADAHDPMAVIAVYFHLTSCFEVLSPNVLTMTYTIDMHSRIASAIRSQGGDTEGREVSEEEERSALLRGDAIIALQENEAKAFRKLVPECEVIVAGHACGMTPGVSGRTAVPGRVLMVGSGNPLNQRGLQLFLDKVWPRVVAELPEARLHVVGALSDSLPETTPNAQALGILDRLEPEYDAASVVVNPVDLGTGLKIKSIESLTMGKALVSTPVGVDGMAIPDRRAFLVEKDWDRFAEAVIAVLCDDRYRKELEAGALEYARTHLTETDVFHDLDQYLQRRASTAKHGTLR